MSDHSSPHGNRTCPVTGIATHRREIQVNGQTVSAGDGSQFFAVGLSFRTAPVALREKLAVAPDDRVATAERLKTEFGIEELVLLWTCNRVEVYGVATDETLDPKAVFNRMAGAELDAEIYCHRGEDALRHLLTVSSGMDSMVLGETEITGQVKNAYESARMARLTGKTLNRTFQKALQTAKQIHTHTGIGRGATSVGSVSVMQAMRLFGEGLSRKTAMVVGAGKMAEACVRHLFDKGVRSIVVANRSLPRAELLAAQFGGRAVHFDQCLPAMAEIDIVISSTGCPLTIFHREDVARVMEQRADRPLFMIDIAVPRDIDAEVADVDGVFLYDIDNLESAIRENVSHREQDLELCRAIIERKVALMMHPEQTQHLKAQVLASAPA